MTKESHEFSDNWVRTTIGEAFDVILGQSPPSKTYNEKGNGLPFFQGKAEFGELYPVVKRWCTQPKKIAEKGDILLSVRAPVGPTNINPEKSCIGRGLAAIRGLSGVKPLFVLYLLRAFQDVLAGKSSGTTFDAITGDRLRDTEISLPPLAEQIRIVSKLEELFSRLDAAIESLQRTKTQLKRYQQSLIKFALEGELTEEWRKTHENRIEPIKTFAIRVAGEEKAQKLMMASRSESTELPDSWAYGKLEDWVHIAGRIGWRGLKASEYAEEGPLLLSVYNLNRGDGVTVDLSDGQHLTERRYQESPEIQLKNNDILLVKDGAGIGKIGIVEGLSGKATVNSSLLVIRGTRLFEPKFLLYFLMGPKMKEVINTRITGSATPHLFQRDIKKFELWIPPLEEQRKIINEVESLLSVADEVEKSAELGLMESERLRHSILKEAFEGRLVPQDPSDEPASRLLERIKQGKDHRRGDIEQARLDKW